MGKNEVKISIIIPIFNEEGNIEILAKNLSVALKLYPGYEIIFIDDGSTDKTLGKIKKLRAKDSKINFISFSRNFGHQDALRAGLDYASGDCVVSMDGDMQHPPKLIPKIIEKWQKGYDIVYTVRKEDPKNSFFKNKTANVFYWLMNKFTDVKIDKGAADFRLMDRKVVEVVKVIKEKNLFMRGMVPWLGFKQIGIKYAPENRNWGETKYSFGKMLKFAIVGITSFSTKPLHLATIFGYAIAAAAFLYGVYAILMKLLTDSTISGWASLLTVVLFIGGVQMIMLGILGEYIGKLFIESKKRPNYIVKEKSL